MAPRSDEARIVVVLNADPTPSMLRIADLLDGVDVRYTSDAGLERELDRGAAGLVLGGTDVPAVETMRIYERQAAAAVDGKVPVLGICGGHQVLALLFGCAVRSLARPRYGRTPCVVTTPDPLFRGLPRDLTVFAKHRFVVADVPDGSAVIARHGVDGDVYGVRYLDRVVGVQFHPERRSATYGMFRSFAEDAAAVAGSAP